MNWPLAIPRTVFTAFNLVFKRCRVCKLLQAHAFPQWKPYYHSRHSTDWLHRILFAVAWTVDLHAPWPDLERRLNPLNTKTINRHPLTTPHLRGIRRLKEKKEKRIVIHPFPVPTTRYLSSFSINIFYRSMSPDSISRFTLLPRSPLKHSVLFRASQWKYKWRSWWGKIFERWQQQENSLECKLYRFREFELRNLKIY